MGGACDLRRQLPAALEVEIGDGHLEPVARQPPADRRPDAAGGARHHRDPGAQAASSAVSAVGGPCRRSREMKATDADSTIHRPTPLALAAPRAGRGTAAKLDT